MNDQGPCGVRPASTTDNMPHVYHTTITTMRFAGSLVSGTAADKQTTSSEERRTADSKVTARGGPEQQHYTMYTVQTLLSSHARLTPAPPADMITLVG